MPFRGRLKSLIQELDKGNVSAFARRCGVEDASVRQWLKGPSKPSLDKALAVAQACDVSLDWLAGAKSEELFESSMAEITKLAFRASAGGGSFVLDEEAGSATISGQLLQRLGLAPNRARLLFASGDSMLPTIADGEPLIVEAGEDSLIDGRIYVFTVGDAAFVKRLRRGPTSLVMISDNPEWPTREEAIPPSELFTLIGRVRWVGRSL